MDVAQIRRANLRKYVHSHFGGNKSAFSRKLNRVPSFFNDLFAGRKSFGEKLARDLESSIGLAPGALDINESVISALAKASPKPVRDWPFAIARERFDALPESIKQQAEGALLHVICDYEESELARKRRPAKRRAI